MPGDNTVASPNNSEAALNQAILALLNRRIALLRQEEKEIKECHLKTLCFYHFLMTRYEANADISVWNLNPDISINFLADDLEQDSVINSFLITLICKVLDTCKRFAFLLENIVDVKMPLLINLKEMVEAGANITALAEEINIQMINAGEGDAFFLRSLICELGKPKQAVCDATSFSDEFTQVRGEYDAYLVSIERRYMNLLGELLSQHKLCEEDASAYSTLWQAATLFPTPISGGRDKTCQAEARSLSDQQQRLPKLG